MPASQWGSNYDWYLYLGDTDRPEDVPNDFTGTVLVYGNRPASYYPNGQTFVLGWTVAIDGMMPFGIIPESEQVLRESIRRAIRWFTEITEKDLKPEAQRRYQEFETHLTIEPVIALYCMADMYAIQFGRGSLYYYRDVLDQYKCGKTIEDIWQTEQNQQREFLEWSRRVIPQREGGSLRMRARDRDRLRD